LARLVALVPPPRHPLIRFHGVFAPHAGLRARVIPSALTATPARADPSPPSATKVAQAPPSSVALAAAADPAGSKRTRQRAGSTHAQLARSSWPRRWFAHPVGRTIEACVRRRCAGLSVWGSAPFHRAHPRERRRATHPGQPRSRQRTATDRPRAFAGLR
jgi:hypothetical protein